MDKKIPQKCTMHARRVCRNAHICWEKSKGGRYRERSAEGGFPLILKEKDCSKNGNNYMEKSSYVQLQTASCSGAISNKL